MTGPINLQLIQQYEAQIRAIKSSDPNACQYLNKILVNVEKDLEAKIASALSQKAIFDSLTTPPTDLVSIISWITTLIGVVKGLLTNAIAADVALIAEFTQLIELISSLDSSLSCNLTIPPIP